MYCMGIVVIFLIILIYASLQVDAYDPQSEVFPRTHEVDCVELTYEEAQLLMQIAAAEAGGEGPDGQRYVMCCVLNRLDSPEFKGDTIAEIIYAPGQFYTAGMSADKVNADTHIALADLEAGLRVPEIIGFEKSESTSLGKYFKVAFSYRHHTFYTLAK